MPYRVFVKHLTRVLPKTKLGFLWALGPDGQVGCVPGEFTIVHSLDPGE